mgnify:CR=1 FL=1
MWQELGIALCLVLVLEGILPFLYVLVDRQQAFQVVASRLLILGTFTH